MAFRHYSIHRQSSFRRRRKPSLFTVRLPPLLRRSASNRFAVRHNFSERRKDFSENVIFAARIFASQVCNWFSSPPSNAARIFSLQVSNWFSSAPPPPQPPSTAARERDTFSEGSTVDFPDNYSELTVGSTEDERSDLEEGVLSEAEIARVINARAVEVPPAEGGNLCAICQDDFIYWSAGRLMCGHVFHASCIKQWLLKKNLCPLCRAPAKSSRGKS